MDNIIKFDYYYGDEAEQFTFYKIPKLLITDERFKELSNDTKLLYGLLLDRMSLSRKNKWLDKCNRVYINYTNENIQEDLNCSSSKVVKMLRELEQIGLVEREHAGQGKPDRIYVKNFVINKAKNEDAQTYQNQHAENKNAEKQYADFKDAENENAEIQHSKIDKSRMMENNSLDLSDSARNKNNINNTDLSYTNPINQSGREEGMDGIDETTKYMEQIKNNISYKYFMNDPDYRKKDLFDEIYNTIIDLVCVKRKTIRIAGEDYPYAMVKDRMLKLKSDHVEYVIEKIESNTKEITNMRAYLITALYNAPTTFNIYLSQKIQHDMYGGD